MPAPSFRVHLPLLDGVRGLAILLVMVFHMTLLQERTPPVRIDAVARAIFSAGWSGVDLFFVLSGFLITGILLDTRERPGYFRLFYARRALRIFPLYYAVVFVSLVVLPAAAAHLPAPAQAKLDRFGTIGADKWMYWTYLSNFAIAHAQKFRHGILDISWSLAIEEQFYLVWPAVVFACSRRALVRVSVGAVLLAIAFRCWLVFYGANAIAVHVLTPSRIDSLAVGAFIAIVARSPGGLGRLAQGARVVAPLSAAILALDFLWRFNTGTGAPGEVGLPSANLPEIQTFGLTAIAIFFGSVLVLTLQAGQAMAASSGRASRSLLVLLFDNMPMRSLGKYSYAMYLFHLPIRAMPRDLLLQKQLPTIAGSQLPAQIAFTFGCIGATYVAAWLSWNLYERHWLALKRFVEYS